MKLLCNIDIVVTSKSGFNVEILLVISEKMTYNFIGFIFVWNEQI